MKKFLYLAFVMLFAPGVGSAQTASPHASALATHSAVADPAATVPPVLYQSVFADTPTGVETKTTDWTKANAEVGQFKRGHVDILKWEASQESAQSNGQGSHFHQAKP